MKTYARPQPVPARFALETRFELKPRIALAPSAEARDAVEKLKTRLLKPALEHASDEALRQQLRLIANDAAAIAMSTQFPLLVLPVLLEEKAAEIGRASWRGRVC